MTDGRDTIFKGNVEIDKDFVQGDKTTIEKLVVNIYGGSASPQFTDEELKTQLDEYRRYLIETYKYLDFKGIDSVAEAVKGSSGLTLESVYVPLRARPDTPDGESWHRVGGRLYSGAKPVAGIDADKLEQEIGRAEAAALPVEQWINTQPALVILGDPGSGKSTALKRLAFGLAQIDDAPLPILLPLNAYSKELDKRSKSFEAYLPEYFEGKRAQLDRDGLKRLFREALDQGRAIVLMDGLDEVGDNRGQVVAQVESFVRAWIPDPQTKTKNSDPQTKAKSRNRMVATSRFVGYRNNPLTDPRWLTVALNDWSREEIERFFKAFTLASEIAWSGGQNPQHAELLAAAEQQDLLRVIDGNPGIRRLAGNPLLASLLALIKRQGVTLPHRRVELYKLYMETLLRSWNRARNIDKQPVGPEIDFSPTQRLLAKLALHLRQSNPQGGLIDEDAMSEYLLRHFQADGYSRKEAGEQTIGFLDSVHKYSNLLIEKGHRQYGFIHLTFEEYLAGFGFALEPEEILHQKIPEYLDKPEHWKETLLLAFGVMFVVNAAVEKGQAALQDLLKSEAPETLLFAGEVLKDVGATVVGNRLSRAIQNALLEVGQNCACSLSLRRRAGLLLGDSGWLPDDLDRFIRIPKGPFLIGEKKVKAEIPEDYWIGKYPVTNAQYRRFIEAGGYENKAFWTSEGWACREKAGWRQPEYWEDSDWVNPLSPVVGVSWYEALAYCSWLENSIQEQPEAYGLTGECLRGRSIRLPSNAEWERASRGTDGREFPWTGDFRKEWTNCSTSWGSTDREERGTTAVNLFQQGASPEGLLDCAGNVWEWLSSLDDSGWVDVRGGSWNNGGAVNVRCAIRDGGHPNNRGGYLGFRVVCAGVLPGS